MKLILPHVLSLAACAAIAAPSSGLAQDSFAPQVDPAISLPGLTSYAPSAPSAADAVNLRAIRVEALLTDASEPMKEGLTWRIFSPIPGPDGKLPRLASAEGGAPDFELAPGEYFVHVAFGRAGVTKKLAVPASGAVEKQSLVLNAGGLVLNAVSGSDARIPAAKLTFKIYKADDSVDIEQQQLVVENVRPNTIIRLNAGTYHIVSSYGNVNAVIRSDIRVEAGKLTEAIIQHRAAQVTLKLVSEPGGEAIADTAWSILTSAGDVVSESVGAFPTIVLAEGQYAAVARNKDKVYQRDFEVMAGNDGDVEVLLK